MNPSRNTIGKIFLCTSNFIGYDRISLDKVLFEVGEGVLVVNDLILPYEKDPLRVLVVEGNDKRHYLVFCQDIGDKKIVIFKWMKEHFVLTGPAIGIRM
jgi:hypothetical protein